MQHGQPAPDLPAAESSPWKSIAFNGILKQNAGVVQLLGLCPVLAVSKSASVASAPVGTSFDYVIQVSNTGALATTAPVQVIVLEAPPVKNTP